MAKRKPQFGDFYVYNQNPFDVLQVDAVMDGNVHFHSRVSGSRFELAVEDFNAHYTRIPI